MVQYVTQQLQTFQTHGIEMEIFPSSHFANKKREAWREKRVAAAHSSLRQRGAGLSGQEASLGQGPPWSAGVILPLTLRNIWHCLGTFLVVTPGEEGNCSTPYGAPDGRPSKELSGLRCPSF